MFWLSNVKISIHILCVTLYKAYFYKLNILNNTNYTYANSNI